MVALLLLLISHLVCNAIKFKSNTKRIGFWFGLNRIRYIDSTFDNFKIKQYYTHLNGHINAFEFNLLHLLKNHSNFEDPILWEASVIIVSKAKNFTHSYVPHKINAEVYTSWKKK